VSCATPRAPFCSRVAIEWEEQIARPSALLGELLPCLSLQASSTSKTVTRSHKRSWNGDGIHSIRNEADGDYQADRRVFLLSRPPIRREDATATGIDRSVLLEPSDSGLADRGRLASMPDVPLRSIRWGGELRAGSVSHSRPIFTSIRDFDKETAI
jgi:hypothetical protein